jgi:chromate transporter
MSTSINTSSHAAAPGVAQAGQNPSCRALFLGFLKLSMMAFGGALPLAHRIVVDQHRWLTHQAFTEILGLCQFLPGSNVVNLAVAVGSRFRGVRGALSALLGLLVLPTVIVVLLSTVYTHFENDPHARGLFRGLACAAAGLLVQMAYKFFRPIAGRPLLGSVALLCCLAIVLLHLPLVWVLLVMTPFGIVISYIDQRFDQRSGR